PHGTHESFSLLQGAARGRNEVVPARVLLAEILAGNAPESGSVIRPLRPAHCLPRAYRRGPPPTRARSDPTAPPAPPYRPDGQNRPLRCPSWASAPGRRLRAGAPAPPPAASSRGRLGPQIPDLTRGGRWLKLLAGAAGRRRTARRGPARRLVPGRG